MLAILQERGLQFEQIYLKRLLDEGKSVVGPEPGVDELPIDRTMTAMQNGADVIYQASLRNKLWQGRADFSLR